MPPVGFEPTILAGERLDKYIVFNNYTLSYKFYYLAEPVPVHRNVPNDT